VTAPHPPPHDHEAWRHHLVIAAAWAFPVALWLVATFALGGRLGKTTDDYSTNLRDPVTNTLPAGFRPFQEYMYFWRPVHLILIQGLQTFFGEYDRLLHLLSAGAHGVVALLLYSLINRVARSRTAAAAAAVLFMVLPFHYEAICFTSFISGPISTALWLWLAIAVARCAAGSGSPGWWRGLAPMTVIALAIPFFYEVPGAAIAAFPLLWLSCAPVQISRAQRLLAAVAVTFALGMTQVLFVALLALSAPAGRRGSPASLVQVSRLFDRLLEVWQAGVNLAVDAQARQLARAGFDLGWTTISTSHLWVWLVPLALTGSAWCVLAIVNAMRPADAEGGERQPSHETRRLQSLLLLACFGVAAAALSMLPGALIAGHTIVPRMIYTALLGIAIAFGALLAAISACVPARSRRWIGVAVAPALVAASCLGAIALVGMQAAYQLRSRADLSVAAQLARLAPNPPADTIFLPVRIDHTPTTTGVLRFDRLRPGAFETVWSATALMRQTLRRRDIWAASCNPWRPPMLTDATPEHIRLDDHFIAWSPFPLDRRAPNAIRLVETGTRLPWANTIPFIVDERGRVRALKRIVFARDGGADLVIDPPLVARMLTERSIRRSATTETRVDSRSAGPR